MPWLSHPVSFIYMIIFVYDWLLGFVDFYLLLCDFDVFGWLDMVLILGFLFLFLFNGCIFFFLLVLVFFNFFGIDVWLSVWTIFGQMLLYMIGFFFFFFFLGPMIVCQFTVLGRYWFWVSLEWYLWTPEFSITLLYDHKRRMMAENVCLLLL